MSKFKEVSHLFAKYDVPVPRYTSYPTVPYWSQSPTREQWIQSLRNAFTSDATTWSLYMHIPFCETLCTFCGCNTLITRNHDKEKPYVATLLKELDTYLAVVPEIARRPLRQLHLGGGTPTFLSAPHLRELIEAIYLKLNVRRE